MVSPSSSKSILAPSRFLLSHSFLKPPYIGFSISASLKLHRSRFPATSLRLTQWSFLSPYLTCFISNWCSWLHSVWHTLFFQVLEQPPLPILLPFLDGLSLLSVDNSSAFYKVPQSSYPSPWSYSPAWTAPLNSTLEYPPPFEVSPLSCLAGSSSVVQTEFLVSPTHPKFCPATVLSILMNGSTINH